MAKVWAKPDYTSSNCPTRILIDKTRRITVREPGKMPELRIETGDPYFDSK
jgi:hypothetical protein